MRVLVTQGEPAGIGPDILIAACQRQWPWQLITIGDSALLARRAKNLGLPLKLKSVERDTLHSTHVPGTLEVIELPLPSPVVDGKLEVGNAGWVLETLKQAALGCLSGDFQALVTAPVHKGIINDAGHSFTGHTEFFAEISHTPRVVMMLATPKLRVALATTHLPLRDVADAISRELITQTLDILVKDLRDKFGIPHPRILVAGLNPHAGEGGHLGREELDVIIPAMQSFDSTQATLIGPLPADTLFVPEFLEDADAVLAMYHDQGLPVLKSQGFGEAINITLGLPFIRTSVDHGTALDLAATGRARSSSLEAAIALAFTLAARKP